MVNVETTRRALMLAPVLAPLAFATPAAAHPDAELLRLAVAAGALQATADALGDDLERAHQLAAQTAPPPATVLQVTAYDRRAFRLAAEVLVIDADALALMRKQLRSGDVGDWLKAKRRAEEVEAAWAAYMEAFRAHRACGRFPAVEEAYEEAAEALGGLEEEILGQPATTLDGLRVKARLAVRAAGARPVTMDHDEAVLWSIVDDLLGPPSSAEVQS